MTPMRTKPLALVLTMLLWTAAAEQTLAITYTTLDYPGSLSTIANDIDGNNIVGTYAASPGVHGYLYNGATYTTLDHPLGTNGSVARGISGGNIVGLYNEASFGSHGFLYNGTTFTTLDDPLATHGTRAFGIDGNNIVGNYSDSSGQHGFLYDGTTYTTLDDPLVGAFGTNAIGISGSNIVGQYNDSSGLHGFLYNGTTYTTLDHPLATNGTRAQGIDGNNIVGQYYDSSGSHGFLYNGSTYTTLAYPLATGGTSAYGIDGNNIVGTYNDSSGIHGFLATVPEPSSGVLGVIACGLTWCWRNRLAKVAMHRTFASLIFFCAISLVAFQSASAVTIPTVPVGNLGNAADPVDGDSVTAGVQNLGSVGYAYRIGTTEVTNAQYVDFLNAKAASDPLGFYDVSMGSHALGGITQSGVSGSFTYAPKTNMANKPVNWVSWYDAIRFANWLNNGQGTGDTETGAYTLGPLIPDGTPVDGGSITRNAGATWFLPSENEWYKAAYHQPAAQGGDADNYWAYPTASNSAPTLATANGVGDISNPGTNVANYNSGADWNSLDGNLTTVGSAGPLSQSFYGTSDQGGNIFEMNESLSSFGSDERVMRGGFFLSPSPILQSSFSTTIYTGYYFPSEAGTKGFRVATIPEPGSGVLGVIACGLMWVLRKRLAKVAMHRNFASLVLVP